MSVVEQRYHAVMEVLAGSPVTEVAARYGVSRKSVHSWLNRYGESGLGGLVDRSHRPRSHPGQVSARVEAMVVQLRIEHPRWGARRLLFELGRAGVDPVPSRSTVYRVLVRHRLVAATPRKRRREDYRRWERPAPMQLWQMDVMGSVRMVDGSEAKLISGVDDHSRFSVIASVTARATSRAVCSALTSALGVYGVPDQILTDNGKQFTGKYTRPKPAEVLFDRICRLNGVEHLLTKIRSPTTTGKVERWHQTIQRELLDDHPPFATIAAAQAAVDAWREEYNTTRPHQALDMASPADRFQPRTAEERATMVLWVPPGLQPSIDEETTPADAAVPPTADPSPRPDTDTDTDTDDGGVAWEIERAVPPSGNVSMGPQQFWFGPQRAGEVLTFWIDDTTVHISSGGLLLKTLPSRFSSIDLARLPRAGARPAGPPPARRLPALTPGGAVEIDRTVTANGLVSIADKHLPVGSPLAGQRVTIRLDGRTAVVMLRDATLWKTLPYPISAAARRRLPGHRPATTSGRPSVGPQRVQRVVSSRGGIQVNKQRVQVGMSHARAIVTVEVGETILIIRNEAGDIIAETPRTNTEEVTRHKAYSRTVNQT
ncbi:IS481 family transposase [Jatrophihabitans sp. GAS493]|uniref:IS481 family transposase n=1 Tax=Jatrophihabitans sp. GAS493 TaxID=1907575 RepID=UPI003529D841